MICTDLQCARYSGRNTIEVATRERAVEHEWREVLRASGAVSRQPALSIADDGLFEAISTDSAKIRNDSIDEGVRHRSPSASDDAARSRIGSGEVHQ